MKRFKAANILKGVSTLDFAKSNFKLFLLFAIIAISGNAIYGGHSILDLVDPSFNPNIQTNTFITKEVLALAIQPDGKILAAGNFNSYNRQLVGKVVRLNADATLDTSFNSPTIESGYPNLMILQADGKIVLRGFNMVLTSQPQNIKQVIRLNSDGSLDTNFNYNGDVVQDIAVDASGRVICTGFFPLNNVNRRIIRLNTDGSDDLSFLYADISVGRIAAQNNKVILYSASTVKRLNEDGSFDATFTATNLDNFDAIKFIIQPDGKILTLDRRNLRRLNANGNIDATFTTTNFSTDGRTMDVSSDGRITVAINNATPRQVRRFLANGTPDPSFTTYNAPEQMSLAVQADGSVIIGDGFNGGSGTSIPNNFSRILPNGTLDTTFNQGGIGFQNMIPGAVRSIVVQPNGKVIIGGKFDAVNDAPRFKIARLNADSTLDTSFQINTSGTGNSFTQLNEIYNAVLQTDGKIVVSGNFIYTINGIQKRNVVRFETNGNIDPAFNLNLTIDDVFGCCLAGTNKTYIQNDGKMVVGTSRSSFSAAAPAPLKLNADGTRDTTFNAVSLTTQNLVYVYDLAIQPDGKIVVGGRYDIANIPRSFVIRLNSDGSSDTTFQPREVMNRSITALTLLPNGKIVFVEGTSTNPVQQTSVVRLNSDGSLDTSFDAGTGANGKIGAILLLPTGKMFIGGKFTSFNGQPRQNLAQINANGSLDPTIYNLNNEVLSLAVDGDGRVLVGGTFTLINVGGGSSNRSYIARLIDSRQAGRTPFDFDGDGRADLGVFEAANRTWSIFNSQNNQVFSLPFGLSTDKIAPADYDGDGKADIAVYRPSEGIWYLMRSRDGFTAMRWGAAEDKPSAGDFDGDGKDDLAVWRPSTAVWYIMQSSNSQAFIVKFGLPGDVPLPRADYDGDGKTDIAVWRASEGNFYWLASGSANAFRAVHFGSDGDVPVPFDFNGDSKTDLIVYRPTEGNWYQNLSAPNGSYTFAVTRFGSTGDVPVPADYDGDGKTDIAVRRGNAWHILNSTQGYTVQSFGNANAQAVAALPF